MRASTGVEATGFPKRNLPKKMTPALADKSPAKAAPRHLETSSSQHRMDIPNLEVVTLSGKRLSLKEDLQEAVRFLEEDGCLVLKGATDLSPVESILSTNKPSVDAVKKDIVLNDVSKAFISRFYTSID